LRSKQQGRNIALKRGFPGKNGAAHGRAAESFEG
jgi:hypothetical protein